METCYLYQITGSAGEIGYLGITNAPKAREIYHKYVWSKVCKWIKANNGRFSVIGIFQSRELAHKYEARLIKKLNPACNKTHRQY